MSPEKLLNRSEVRLKSKLNLNRVQVLLLGYLYTYPPKADPRLTDGQEPLVENNPKHFMFTPLEMIDTI